MVHWGSKGKEDNVDGNLGGEEDAFDAPGKVFQLPRAQRMVCNETNS